MKGIPVERSDYKTAFRKDPKKKNITNEFYKLKTIQKTFFFIY